MTRSVVQFLCYLACAHCGSALLNTRVVAHFVGHCRAYHVVDRLRWRVWFMKAIQSMLPSNNAQKCAGIIMF